MCITKKDMALIFSDMVDKLPYISFELTNDFTLEVMVELKTKDNIDFCVYLNFSKKGLQLNIVSKEQYHKIKAYLIEEPTKHKQKLPYHKGVTGIDLVDYLKEYLKDKTEVDWNYCKQLSINGITNKYFKENYFTLYYTDEAPNEVLVEDGKESFIHFRT